MRVSSMPTRLLCGAAAISALIVAGCGAGGGTDTTAAGGGEAPPVAEFVATDRGFEGPKQVPGGVVDLQLTNDGKDLHNLQLLYADGDYTEEEVLGELQKAMNGEPVADWFHAAGGVSKVEPGETQSVVQSLEPDTTYYGVDDETESDEPQAAVSFETGEDSGAELPEADATITAADFSFEAEGLTAGENIVQFSNDGQQWHHVVSAPLGDSSIEEVTEYFQQEDPQGPPPIEEDENAPYSNVIDAGQAQNLAMNFDQPGRYALLCFISNREGGPPHVALGMVEEVEIE